MNYSSSESENQSSLQQFDSRILATFLVEMAPTKWAVKAKISEMWRNCLSRIQPDFMLPSLRSALAPLAYNRTMDTSTTIDLKSWPRRAHFDHYRQSVPCTYSMTVELDATAFHAKLKASDYKTYIAQIWALSTVVNNHNEFKMFMDPEDNLALWSTVHPSFTIFNPELETFSNVWTPYSADFEVFHDTAAKTITDHQGSAELFPQASLPTNLFNVSSIPWRAFTGFNLHVDGVQDHFAPIFTLGKYYGSDGRILLPLSIQVHHAVIDGYHTARCVNEIEELLANMPI